MTMTARRMRRQPMARHPALMALLGAGLLGSTACGGDAAEAPTAELSIVDFAFEPAELEVAVGSTVQVTNADSARHTATAQDGTFDLSLDGGATGSFTVDAPGSYAYVCSIHPSMTGTLVVS
jgi:plastocyanin